MKLRDAGVLLRLCETPKHTAEKIFGFGDVINKDSETEGTESYYPICSGPMPTSPKPKNVPSLNLFEVEKV